MALEVLLFIIVALAFPIVLAALTVRRAQDMEAVVVRERITGRVTNLCIGPRWYICLPAIDEVKALDLHFHRTLYEAQSIQTYEGLAASVTVTVGWQQLPARLAGIDLREVLPFLPDTEEIVNRWILFVVRDSVSRYTLASLQRIMRHPAGFQALLAHDLQERVEALGVEVLNLDLICLPAPSVVAARISAEARAQELQTIAMARAMEIQMLSQALACGTDNDHLVKLLAVDALRGGDKRVFTALDLDGSGGMSPTGGGGLPIQFVVGP